MCWKSCKGPMGVAGNAPEWESKVIEALANLKLIVYEEVPNGQGEQLLIDIDEVFDPIDNQTLKVVKALKDMKEKYS